MERKKDDLREMELLTFIAERKEKKKKEKHYGSFYNNNVFI